MAKTSITAIPNRRHSQRTLNKHSRTSKIEFHISNPYRNEQLSSCLPKCIRVQLAKYELLSFKKIEKMECRGGGWEDDDLLVYMRMAAKRQEDCLARLLMLNIEEAMCKQEQKKKQQQEIDKQQVIEWQEEQLSQISMESRPRNIMKDDYKSERLVFYHEQNMVIKDDYQNYLF